MSTLEELVRRQVELEHAIARARDAQREMVLTEIRAIMTAQGLTVADLGATRSRPESAHAPRRPVAAKYRDENGNSWSGRGLKPKWLTQALDAGKSLTDFAV